MNGMPVKNELNSACSSDSVTQNGNSNKYFTTENLNNSSGSYNQKYKRFGRHFFRGRGRGRFVTPKNINTAKPSKKNNKNEAPYGNYSFYYGYRNQCTEDKRISFLKSEWITNKYVLDVGCNVGHLTLALAQNFSPCMIIGMDIDSALIRMAKKNTKHYLSDNIEYDSEFPISCVSQFGPLALAPFTECENIKFPFNICFIQGNYVLESDDLMKMEEEKFDTILCLSLTKWIQLNWGDEGLKRVFFRMYAQLRNGGHLILEPQPLKSYYKSKKISDTHRKHYSEMKLFPEQYNQYLLEVVGFKTCELINDIRDNLTEVKGFERPLYLFTKVTDDSCNVPKHVIFQNNETDNSSEEESDMEEADELSD